jgi:predicted nuclease of restriction endonuclease-like (RecB) superfamily
LADIVGLLEAARRASARTVNVLMTATYWEVGRRIVEQEQGGGRRAGYGAALIASLSADLTTRYGRGFSMRNLEQMRLFYLAWPIAQTVSAQSPSNRSLPEPVTLAVSKVGDTSAQITQTPSAQLSPIMPCFSLPWSHYVKLLAVQDPEARAFYETEALRGGWSVRQLDRQISSKFYERALLSRNKAAMLRKGTAPRPEDTVTVEEEIKDPLVLEFLGLKDEYSESELEEALIRHLEAFLLELGGEFAFVGRQRRLRIGDEWYRIDLLFFHRRLQCLVVIDLKLGKFTHADAGQMHMYLNYAREHWTHEHENPPVGLILCAQKNEAVAHYALEGLPNRVLATEYRTALPNEQVLIAELKRTQKLLESRRLAVPKQHRVLPASMYKSY